MFEARTNAAMSYLQQALSVALSLVGPVKSSNLSSFSPEYAGVHGTMKYVKIAYMLDQKTVRDVALRCRWLSDNAIGSCSYMNSYLAIPKITASNSQLMHQGTQFDQLSSQVDMLKPSDGSTNSCIFINSCTIG